MERGSIKYVIGDATEPILGEKKGAIIHCCNNKNLWGSGFVIALSNKWSTPENLYKVSYYNGRISNLGDIQTVYVEPNLVVINMIGQRGVFSSSNPKPIQYWAINECLLKVVDFCEEQGITEIHAPRFGADRAKGRWGTIESIIEATLCSNNINVTIYDLPEKTNPSPEETLPTS